MKRILQLLLILASIIACKKDNEVAKFETLPLSEVTGIKAEAKSDSIILTWDIVPQANFYLIYRDDEKPFDTRDNRFVDSNLTPNTKYSYSIIGKNNTTESKRMVSISVDTKPPAMRHVVSNKIYLKHMPGKWQYTERFTDSRYYDSFFMEFKESDDYFYLLHTYNHYNYIFYPESESFYRRYKISNDTIFYRSYAGKEPYSPYAKIIYVDSSQIKLSYLDRIPDAIGGDKVFTKTNRL